MPLLVTSIAASFAALMHIWLSFQVIKRRRLNQAALGDAGSSDLQCAIRAHGNFTESTPLFLILILLLEVALIFQINDLVFISLPAGLAVMFFAGRICHAYSLLRAERYENGKMVGIIKWRVRGMMMTFFALGGTALSILLFLLSSVVGL